MRAGILRILISLWKMLTTATTTTCALMLLSWHGGVRKFGFDLTKPLFTIFCILLLQPKLHQIIFTYSSHDFLIPSDIIRGVPQDSILQPLFSSGLLLFIKKSKMCNFTNDSTSFNYGQDILDIMRKIMI